MHLLINILIFIFSISSHLLNADIQELLKRNKVLNLSQQTNYRNQLAIAMIFRDEAPYLKEWIEYHKILGVERFYLYNNLSNDNYSQILSPYIVDGIVELIEWPEESLGIESWRSVQSKAYQHAIEKAKGDRVKWLAMIDADEFLVPRKVDSLSAFLKDYEDDYIGGLRVGWVMFGTSYVKKIPADKTLIECLVLNQGYKQGMWKSIVRPDRVDARLLGGAHSQEYSDDYDDPLISSDLIQCNHYWSRDESYLNSIKIPRLISWGTPIEEREQWGNKYNQVTPAGEPILRFVPQLRKNLGFIK